jgi:hypothetical protein
MMEVLKSVPHNDPLKWPDGRPSDRGIQIVEAAFRPCVTDAEVARQFEISPSVASNRRRIWIASGANTPK